VVVDTARHDTAKAIGSMLKTLIDSLVETALDQPNPTSELWAALDNYLTANKHPNRDYGRDPA
jgi:hypothetical protein